MFEIKFKQMQLFSVFRSLIKADGHSEHLQPTVILYPSISGKSYFLTLMYMNLLSNALKYTQEGGTVFLKVQEKEIPGTQKVELVSIIRDTGIGMEKEFMDVMYSKFSRAIDMRVNKVSGSGLGLSIVKKIVDLLDGKIEVRSVPEHGTTFKVTLRLPYCEEMQGKEEPKEISFDRTIKLLVAEDNDLNYEIEKELLAMHGIRTERASDGEVCVRKVKEAKEGTYDAILMDMQMPVMDGVTAAREILCSDAWKPVWMLIWPNRWNWRSCL